MPDLTPCPFCGSKNVYSSPGRKGTTKSEPFLYCRDCGAEGPYNRLDWHIRAKGEAVHSTSTNTAMVKFSKTVDQVIEDVRGELESPNFHWEFIVREVYDILERELRHS